MNKQNRASEGLRVDPTAGNYIPDRSSMSPAFSLASVPPVSPEPAYIAAAAAANVIAGEIAHEYHVELADGASVSVGSLHLINTFLDRLLFNFLSCAHSTSLGALRPAVTEVLRPRLAREAIAGADEELEEYLGGDPEEMDLINSEKQAGPWDLDVAWKRTRLRCMLYTRLGDMEEEEEEMFLEQDNLQEGGQPGAYIQPAVAIFLTSVLEFIGEHALMIAAQAAYKRHETRARIENVGFRKITVEEVDMEKNAVNSTLGRLWRSWRASIRSPRGSMSRIHGMGPRGFRGFSVSSRSSMTTESHLPEEPEKVPSVEEVLEAPDPSTIALPTTIYDVDEIEVPGFSAEYAQRSRKEIDRLRPHSMFIRTGAYTYEEDGQDNESTESDTEEEESTSEDATPIASFFVRPRASSLPLPIVPFFIPPYTPSENSFSTTLQELPQNGEFETQPGPIIDGSGNSVSVIGDYAIPKSNSAPSSPFGGGSMLNAISARVAHGTFYHEDDSEHDHDPADGVLQFDRNDYEIGEHEHSNLGSRVSTIEPTKNLQGPFDYPVPVAVSPLVGATDISPSGAVSPLEAEFPRAEISPMGDLDDEESYIPRKNEKATRNASPTSPVSTGSIAAITSPIVAATATAAGAAAVIGVAHQRKVDQAEQPEPVIIPRANQGRQRSREGPTLQDYTKEENRETFVLPQEVNLAQAPDDIPRSVPDLESRRWRPADKSPIATTLPPVRESFEKPPVSPTLADQSQSSRQYPVSRKAVPSTKPLPSVSPQHQRQLANIQTDIDPITDQRIVVSPVSNKSSPPASRTSDGSIRAVNPAKQTITKSKGRGASLTSDQRDSLPSVSSSDGPKSANNDRFSRSSTSNSDSHRDFDQLINSGETVKYTLTSQSMREIEERGRNPNQKAPASAQRQRTPPTEQNKTPTRSTPSPQSMNGLRSNPINELPVAPFVVHAGPTIKRGPQLVAKDARMERTNTSELKDFFRSTGPDSGPPAPSPVVKGPSAPSPAVKRLSGPVPRSPRTQARVPGEDRRLVSGPSSGGGRAGPVRTKSKFEPREATRSSDNTAMLAQFLREGPPSAQRGAVPKPGFDENVSRYRDAPPSVASTQDSYVARSVQSSTNSRVGLLDSTRAQNNAIKTSPAWQKRAPQPNDESTGPVRKQRRVRDPYAIDTDSEDEEDETGTPRAGRRDNEESLLDFLRNAEPPTEPTSTPSATRNKAQSQEANRVSSGSMIKSRFGSTNKKNLAQSSANVPRSVSNPNTSKYSSPQSNAYANSRSPPASQPDYPSAHDFDSRPVPRMNGNGVRQARKLARDGKEDSTSIRDLAEFLRNTEPPPSAFTQQPLPPTPAREESGGFTRMFSRRKKGVIA